MWSDKKVNPILWRFVYGSFKKIHKLLIKITKFLTMVCFKNILFMSIRNKHVVLRKLTLYPLRLHFKPFQNVTFLSIGSLINVINNNWHRRMIIRKANNTIIVQFDFQIINISVMFVRLQQKRDQLIFP